MSVLAGLMFRGVVTEDLWGPVLPGGTSLLGQAVWIHTAGGGEGTGKVRDTYPGTAARLLDTLRIREWETIRGIAGT